MPALEPTTSYAATGSGGLWKSVNNGISWEPIYDAQPAYPTFGGTLPADVGGYTVVVSAGGSTFTKKVQVLEDVWFDRMF